ncbi:hypothetical protein [Aquabacter spiritensis]|uniref:Uncharacterized protein n=1 Tax=Aquabacter spiritensis TaxID=933073 RepID=A0A4V2UYQ1_9HYPH|nr:hypothetical protein [Aquabacter spiritensis]TCT08018.1 hypothetical protein EDC64_101537 [Aquabacter spiritensis]
MSGFDLLSRVFAILLGLSIAELLKGVARVCRVWYGVEHADRAPLRIGALIPLLVLLTLFDQVTFWFNFAAIGPHLPADELGLFGLVLVSGAYFAVSTFVLPAEVGQWRDFDDYYMKVRRLVIGGLMAVNLIGLACAIGLALADVEIEEARGGGQISGPMNGLALVAMVALLLVRTKRANLAWLIVAVLATIGAGLPL